MSPHKRKGNAPKRRRAWRRLLTVALLGAAVLSELAKPKEQRTWTGRIGGIVPYDLRRPSVRRFRERVWNADDRRIVVPTAFGVGWTLNLRSLINRVRG